ncbi:MAG: hypothetical protein QXU54_02885 [Candidatus Micrarchaeia archaeon]
MDKDEKLEEDAISKGGILLLMFFDSHGNTEDEVKNRLTELFAKLVKEDGVVYGRGEIEVPVKEEIEVPGPDGKPVKQATYSSSGEVKVLTKDFRTAFRLASMYGPVYVEVLKPQKRMVGFEEMQEVLNDVSQTSYSLSQFIVKNTLKGPALAAFMKNIKYREKLGEKLRAQGGSKK